MDHAAAHERIEDLLLEPTRLASLAASKDPADIALRDHVASCATCRTDLESWQELQHRLAVALPGSVDAAASAVDPIDLPPSLRAAVITSVRDANRAPAPAASASAIVRAVPGDGLDRANRRPRRAVAGWLAIAASVVVLAGSVGVTIDQIGQRATAEAQAAGLSSAIAAVDRVLVAPEHWIVGLKDSTGAGGGSISWSSQDLVVLTTALEPPPDGQQYACWLVDDSSAAKIGTMYFAGRTAYWVGSLDEWATFKIRPGTRFVVTLPDPDTTRFGGPIYLSADLGG